MNKLTVFMILLLAGCATPGEVMQTPPDATVALRNPPELAASCISRNLDGIASNITVDRRPTAQGLEFIAKVTGDIPTIFAAVHLTAAGSGSNAQVWAWGTMEHAKPRIAAQLVKGC